MGNEVPASVAGGRYRVERFLGAGGRKRVYLARDARLDRPVALALIDTAGIDDAGRERIRREAQAMARLGDHPHIVNVYDMGEEDGHAFLVSQFMAGETVEELIERAASGPPPARSSARPSSPIRPPRVAHARHQVPPSTGRHRRCRQDGEGPSERRYGCTGNPTTQAPAGAAAPK